MEKDAVALDEEKGEIIIVELRDLHQFNDSIDNFVMRKTVTQSRQALQSENETHKYVQRSLKPKAQSDDHVFNSVTRVMGMNCGRRVLTTCTTRRQSSKAVVPTASSQERGRCFQLRTLGDQSHTG